MNEDQQKLLEELQNMAEELERLREIEEAAREVSFHDGNDTACLCPVHGGLCRRCQAFDRLRTALDADKGGQGE